MFVNLHKIHSYCFSSQYICLQNENMMLFYWKIMLNNLKHVQVSIFEFYNIGQTRPFRFIKETTLNICTRNQNRNRKEPVVRHFGVKMFNSLNYTVLFLPFIQKNNVSRKSSGIETLIKTFFNIIRLHNFHSRVFPPTTSTID